MKFSGSREGELGVEVSIGRVQVVRATGTAGLGASAQGFVNDALDGTGAPATLSAATEAAIDLLGIAGEVFGVIDRTADIMVADDVTGTNNHENGWPFGDAKPSIFKTAAGCKRKNSLLK